MARVRVQVSQDGLHREVTSEGLCSTLTYDISPRGAADPPPFRTSDFALIALLPIAMHKGEALEADFPVDSKLLDGLDHFQEVWRSWRPDIFRHRVEISAPEEATQPSQPHRPARAVAAFSGGIDSTFTIARHVHDRAGRTRKHIRTAVLVHGFDMPLDAQDGFDALARHANAITEALGVELVTVRTNWRKLTPNWEMTFGAGLAAVLHQFAAAHDVALIATEESYQNCFPVWGNSFWTDRFFSSSAFAIESDGGAYDRIERTELVGKYPQLVPHLRVCWAGPRTGENCGTCPKCTLSKLNLLAAGVPEPWPFPQGLTAANVHGMTIRTRWQIQFLELILARLEAQRDAAPDILAAVRERVARERMPAPWKLPIGSTIKRLLAGA
jgi:hypothetical protein